MSCNITNITNITELRLEYYFRVGSQCHLIYGVPLGGLLVFLCLVSVIVILKKCCTKKKSVRSKRVKSSTRLRQRSHGSVYNIKTQEECFELPEHSAQFEYENVLIEHGEPVSSAANVTILSNSQGYHTTGSNHRSSSESSLMDHSRKITNVSKAAGLPDTVRLSSTSTSEVPILVQSSGETAGQQTDLSVHVQQHVQGRESTVSMIRDIQSQTGTEGGIPRVAKIQTTTTQNRTFLKQRQRTRSMLDPLPNVPGEDSLQGSSPLVKVVNETHREDLLKTRPSVDKTTKEPNEINFEDGTILDVDIPSFQDPETNDELNVVSIYSSQILSKFEQTEITKDPGEAELGDNTNDEDISPKSSNIMIEPEQGAQYRKLGNNFTSQGPSLTDDTKALINDSSTSTGAHPWGDENAVIYENPLLNENELLYDKRSAVKDEVLYDKPITVLKKGPEDDNKVKDICFEDTKDIFDDPGYTQGMMAKQSSAGLGDGLLKESSNSSQRELSSCNHIPCGTAESDSRHTGSTPSGSANKQDGEKLSGQGVEGKTVCVGSGVTGQNAHHSSPALIIDYCNEELGQLDPDIASCFLSDHI